MPLHLLGIRHHGPGSSRHVLDALHDLKPDIILIEGPPEGEAMLSWVAHQDMKPPVALLAYVPDQPQQAVFYPFTSFSPEWNAIRYGLEHKIPVRFIDMPLVHQLAGEAPSAGEEETVPEAIAEKEEEQDVAAIRRNPIAWLADIAGFDDAEEWWEQQFEIAHHATGVFDAVTESMTALRDHLLPEKSRREVIREAFMRRAIRTAQKEMYADIVVVCGAWHVPALSNMPAQKEDDALLKGLPKIKIETTWIPWTNDRLSFESGYGAGLESPGWYQHHWTHPEDNGAVWLAHTARVFRRNQVDVSAAHIIEAVRLSQALAALRGIARPGLKEFNEATQAVMCMGDNIPMQLIRKELIVGHDMGAVPEGTPQVPLQRDFEQQAKKLRLKISNEPRSLKLDLREDQDLQKSVLLHRLLLLNIGWGQTQYTSGKGTFKEEWTLCWFPELTIQLLEKAPWGNTIGFAANAYLEHAAVQCTRLDEITGLVSKALPAGLHSGIRMAMKRMDELAAGTSDTSLLMGAFIPLVKLSRYGNVRRTDLETVNIILQSVFYRITAGLPMTCLGIDEEQAAVLADKIREVNQSVLLLDDAVLKDAWKDTVFAITGQTQAAPEVQGCCCKILYDAGTLDEAATAQAFSRALSPGSEPAFAAQWLEGFLKDAATVLILDDKIWHIVHSWVLSLDGDLFVTVLPLLRRTFSVYGNVEKRKIADRARHAGTGATHVLTVAGFDEARAARILPVLTRLMGL
ncbi:DUF5682 family protein [Taibaiella koreensis]|uniref:DUF5682 family protein n=1 Tax=Taibaiella koreensis TaxID=1268548 RepID=UPI000E59F085|nr:DUF5682 family protein [Taibaiella koreensis]